MHNSKIFNEKMWVLKSPKGEGGNAKPFSRGESEARGQGGDEGAKSNFIFTCNEFGKAQ